MTDPYADWIRGLHEALSPRVHDRQAAAWGSMSVRHRTTRPEWFEQMDRAWAQPLDNGTDVDVISAAIADLPAGSAPPPIRTGDLGARGEVPVPPCSGTRMTWADSGARIQAWDPESGKALLIHADAPDPYELVSPMKNLVHWVVAAQGGLLVHGAAVGLPHGNGTAGLLILGESGYGKSTTTLACVAQGWLTCGDDSVAVFSDEGGWSAVSIYSAIKTKLGLATPIDMPPDSLVPVSWEIGGVKKAHLLTATDTQTLTPRMRLAAAILLDPGADSLAPVSPVAASQARNVAAPVMVMLLPFDRQDVLGRFSALLSELQVLRLPRRQTLQRTVEDLADILVDSQPQVSVIIPIYRGRAYVREAIDSVLAQTVGRFEIVAVNDASPDDSLAIVEAMREVIEAAGHSLVVEDLPENQGIAATRNAGMAAASKPLISWLDQDDLWPAERTAQLWAELVRSDARLVIGRMTFQDIAPDAVRSWARSQWFEQQSHPGNALGSILCRREVFDEVGLLADEFRSGYDDVDWLMRVRSAGVATAHIEQVTLVRRVHADNQSQHSRADELLAVVRAHRQRQEGKGT